VGVPAGEEVWRQLGVASTTGGLDRAGQSPVGAIRYSWTSPWSSSTVARRPAAERSVDAIVVV
jgi:hypothetical protein